MNLRNLVRLLIELPLGLAVAALVAVALAWSTESGTRLVLGSAAARINGLSWGETSGSAASGITLTDLVFENEAITVRGGSVFVAPSLFGLLAGELRLIEPTLADVDVIWRSPPPSATASAPIDIPLTVALRGTNATAIGITIDDQAPVTIEHFDFDMTLGGKQLALDIARLQSAGRHVKGHATARLNPPFDFSGRLEVLALPGLPEGASPQMTFTGDADQLQANAALLAPLEARASANIDWAGTATVSIVAPNLASLTAEVTFTPGDSPRLDAALSGDLLDQDLTGTLSAGLRDGAPIGSLRLKRAGNALSVDLNANQLDLSATLPALASLQPALVGTVTATARLDLDSLEFNATATGENAGYGDLRARSINLEASGVANGDIDLEVQLAGVASGEVPIGSGTAVLFGRPDEAALQINWQREDISASVGGRLRNASDGLSLAIARGKVDGLPIPVLTLSAPTTLRWRDGTTTATNHCWRVGDAGDVCLSSIHVSPIEASLDVMTTAIELRALTARDLAADIVWSIPNATLSARGVARVLARNGVPLEARDVELVATGPVSNLAIDTRARLQTGAQEAALDTRARLDGDGLRIDSMTLTHPELELDTRGRWSFTENTINFSVTGRVRNRDLSGGGSLDLAPALSGKARLDIDGNAATLELDATADNMAMALVINELTAIVPGYQGRMTANASLSTEDAAWRVDANATDLSGAGTRIESVVMSGTGRGADDIDVTTTLVDVERGTIELTEAGLTLSGSPAQYHARLTVAGRPIDADIDVLLSANADAISGEMQSGSVSFPRTTWTLAGPVPFSASPTAGKVEPHCWATGDARFCIEALHFDGAAATLVAEMRNAPIAFRGAAWAPEVDVDGSFNLSISGRAPRPIVLETITGDAAFSASALKVTYFEEDSVQASVGGSATLAAGRLDAQIEGSTDEGDLASAKGRVPDITSIDRFSAQGRLESNNLGIVTAFVPQLDRATGSVSADLSMNTLEERTRANVDIRVGNGAAVVVPAAGVEFTDIEFNARGDADRIAITLTGRAGEGTFNAEGAINAPLSAERSLEIDIGGDRLTALDRADIRLVTSPTLRFFYQGEGTAKLTGDIVVNDGRFNLTDLQSQGRSVSPDVVVVARERSTTPMARTDLDLDIDIEHFLIDLYGLRGDVQGNVDLIQRPGTPRRVTGTVNLIDGSFARYGQRFAIERGRLVFSGPMTNPLIDVVSVRTIEEPGQTVRVSLALSGPASNIRSTISASPTMSEARALSYLILGRSLQSANRDDEGALSAAALALGLRQAAPVTEQVRKQLGLEALTLSSEGMDSATVIAGKRLSEDLYVEYTYDILGRTNGLQLQYRLTDRLSLQTHTGEQKSMQLIYLID